MKNLILIMFSLLFFSGKSQIITEKNPPEFIKTIVFKGEENGQMQFPLVIENQVVSLSFDDLTASENPYYYQITHCNADWSPSDLLKSEYLKGFDNQPIFPSGNSYGTLQQYSHYNLLIPNSLTQLKLTGNYIITILDSSKEEIFSRRFVVYRQRVAVEAEVKRTRDLQFSDSKQSVQFSVKSFDKPLLNPSELVKITLLQNFNWQTAIAGLKPQYVNGNQLIFRYDLETSFDAGNEYLYFDTKDLRVGGSGVAQISQTDRYEHSIFTDQSRANRVYSYNPDINGNFLVNALNVENTPTEADYTWVHFSLEAQPHFWQKEVFVYGKFSNYELSEPYKLHYDEKLGVFKGKILLKQGFYNYKYVTKSKNTINLNEIDGNFYQTENNYLILVYYRPIGSLYDEVIGVGSANSTTISR